MIKGLSLITAIILCISMAGCNASEDNQLNFEKKERNVPAFSADSAYKFIEKQLSFGPRNPGSKGHRAAGEYLMNKMESYAGKSKVFGQEFTEPGYGQDTLQLTNIIAAFNPRETDRIMLCAHWDTRPRADEGSVDTEKPIPGADDGASGVAVLLELARLFEQHPPPIGVDLVLFDGEDYGKSGDLDKYFMGSRYWSQNPPVKGYAPRFGILLDMVGGKGARFPQEQYSLRYAPALVNEVWTIAQEEGFADLFIDKKGNAISDDHVVINQALGIPTIDIIRHNTNKKGNGFAPYWHTQNDDISIIDSHTLDAVGQELTELIYNRI